jgi:outer membrane receptor protein involved in Fe transport
MVFPDSPGTPRADTAFASKDWTRHWTLSARADRTFTPRHDGFARVSIDRLDGFLTGGGGFGLSTTIAEVELQDNRRIGARQHLSAGVNLRAVRYDLGGYNHDSSIRFFDAHNTEHLYGGFVQDRIELAPTLDVTLGAKAETWTQIKERPEFSPSARLSWRPKDDLTLWTAASRSITTPGYIQTNIELRLEQIPPAWYWISQGVPAEQVPENAGLWVTLTATDDVEPTDYRSLEWGLRKSFDRATIDGTLFYTRSAGRFTLGEPRMGAIAPSRARPGEALVPVYYSNLQYGSRWGGELLLRAQPWQPVRLEASHSWFRVAFHDRIDPVAGAAWLEATPDPPQTPEHVVRVRVNTEVGGGVNCDVRAIWSSETSSVEGYDYLLQQAAAVDEGGVVRRNRSPLDLSIATEKSFFGGALEIQAWGRKLLLDDQVEAYSTYAFLGYPHTVSRSVGLAIRVHSAW